MHSCTRKMWSLHGHPKTEVFIVLYIMVKELVSCDSNCHPEGQACVGSAVSKQVIPNLHSLYYSEHHFAIYVYLNVA